MVFWVKYTAVFVLVTFVLQVCVWSQIFACTLRAECKQHLSCSRDLSCRLYPGNTTSCSCFTQIIRCGDSDCTCPLGIYGEGCQAIVSDPCEAVTCLNDGQCVRGICECICGYSEPDCGVDSCNNRCLNNATCNNGICVCPPMFTGEDCETRVEPDDLCEPNPCINVDETCYPVEDGIECRCIYIQDDKIITSPNYPDNYPDRFIKCYLIIGRPGQNITLHLDADFIIETSNGCKFDYLEIQGERYCGSVPPDTIVRPPGDNTTVRFKTDISRTRMGFNLTITYTDVVRSWI